MGAPIWKGTQGPVAVNEEVFYDSENLTYWKRFIYRGSKTAISGLELDLQADGVSYEITNDGPVYELVTQIPIVDPAESIDRYEITTEANEISIYSNEDVFEEAFNWDANRGDEQRTYKRQVDEMIDEGTAPDLDTGAYPLFLPVVDHVRGGVDTFQRDYLVLRRYRRLSGSMAVGAGRINLRESSLIYTTAELQLPSNVAFVVPGAPALPTRYDQLFMWGWRMRGQGVDIIGPMIEQRFELVFGPHSLIDNQAAGDNLDW